MSSKITRVGIISDTHIKHSKDIPSAIPESFKSLDLIIHLGDFVSPELLDYLKSLSNFYGVAGNHDPKSIKAVLPQSDVVEINGKRLGLLHGYWSPFFGQQRSLGKFKNDNVDAILYGHTHVIRNEKIKDILFFNPGSAAAMWPSPWKTYGILNIGDTVTGEIVSIANKEKVGLTKYMDAVIDRAMVLKWICGSSCIPDYSLNHLYNRSIGEVESI